MYKTSRCWPALALCTNAIPTLHQPISVVSSRSSSILSGHSQPWDFPATPSRHSRSSTDPGYSSPAPRRGSKIGDRIAFYEERGASPSLPSASPSLHSRSPSVPTSSPRSTSYTMPSISQFTAQSPTSYGYTKSSTHPSLSQVTTRTRSSSPTRSSRSSQSSSSTGRRKPPHLMLMLMCS